MIPKSVTVASAPWQKYRYCCLTPLGRYPREIPFVQGLTNRSWKQLKKSLKGQHGNYCHKTSDNRTKITKWACKHGKTRSAKNAVLLKCTVHKKSISGNCDILKIKFVISAISAIGKTFPRPILDSVTTKLSTAHVSKRYVNLDLLSKYINFFTCSS